MQADLTIKMPDSVPPAVSKAFAAILPTIALYVVAIINFTVSKLSGGQLLIDLIQKYIAEPFLGLSQGLGAVLIVTVLFKFSGSLVFMGQTFWHQFLKEFGDKHN